MMRVVFWGVLACVGALAACKQQGESSTAAASRTPEAVDMTACQLSASQVKLLSSSGEYQKLEKVDLTILNAPEKAALENNRSIKECSSTELSAISESFPSIATALVKPAVADGANTSMALGADMGMGMGGVVRTDYIIVPRTGTRYLAGYNSDGIIVLLQRLMQHRPR